MSAWSDWKCGALSDEEYQNECARENRMERIYDMMDDAECDESWEDDEEEDVNV